MQVHQVPSDRLGCWLSGDKEADIAKLAVKVAVELISVLCFESVDVLEFEHELTRPVPLPEVVK